MKNNNSGFIKLDRKLLEWEWLDDCNTFAVFVYCILRANYQDTSYRGIELKRGSFITSYADISKKLGISYQQARTAVSHLKSTGEITVNQQPKFSIISVKNYSKYQADNRVANSKSTGNQQSKPQSSNSQSTTDKNIKNIYYVNKENKEGASHNFSQPKADYGGTFEVEGR